MNTADRHRLREFLATWQAFALAAVPAMLGSLWATFRLGPSMSAVDLAEWALLIALLTVVGSISQFGIKPGYMQEVTDRGAEHRHAALRSSLLAVGTSGLLAGTLVAAFLYFLWTLGEWHNLVVLPWLPLYGLLGNAGMMFQTDLRILGGARLLAALAIVTFPLSVLLLEAGLRAGIDPLAAFFATQCAVGLLINAWLAHRSRILQHAGLDPAYLRRVLLMGLPVMGGLLSRYVADLSVSATFRWGVDDASAGAFGLAVRVTEPLMALYIGSFQMAWGAHIYGWIRESPDGALARRHSSHSWWLAALGVPLGVAIALLVFAFAQQGATNQLDWLFAAMMISRVLAFGMASTMGFGQTLRRNYTVGMRLAAQEMLLSLALLPVLALTAGAVAALTAAAVLPWITVARLRASSARSL
jgi:O-antigen/teichoic acid export membrane protein